MTDSPTIAEDPLEVLKRVVAEMTPTPEAQPVTTQVTEAPTAEAVEALTNQLAEAQARIEELESSVASATADDLQRQLDVAKAERAAAQQELADVVAYLEQVNAEQAAAAEAAAAADEVRAELKALSIFTDDEIEQRVPVWAAKSAEDRQAHFEELKAVAGKRVVPGEPDPPIPSAMAGATPPPGAGALPTAAVVAPAAAGALDDLFPATQTQEV